MLVVTDRWDAALGGRERYADDLVAHLTAEGREVTRAVRGPATVQPGIPVLALTPVRYATHYQLHSGLVMRAFAAERLSLESVVRRALFNAALHLNSRRLRLLHEEARLLRGSARLMAFSESVARDLVERYAVLPRRITVSRPGVNLRLFHPPRAANDDARAGRVRLVFVGHNFALKGLRSAIHAVARAARSGVDVSLKVAGRGRRAHYQRLAAALDIPHRVTFLGSLTQSQIADLYRMSDALIHPTFYDPFPRVAIEALASSCPVITTACCGAAEILTSGVDGIVVTDAMQVDQLARAIATLADGPTLRRMRGAAADSGRRFDDLAHFRAATTWLFEDELVQ